MQRSESCVEAPNSAANRFDSKLYAVWKKSYDTKNAKEVIGQVVNSAWHSKPCIFVHRVCNLFNNGVSECSKLVLSIVKRTPAPVPAKAEPAPACEEVREGNSSETWSRHCPEKPSSVQKGEKKTGAAIKSSTQPLSLTQPSSQLPAEPVTQRSPGGPQFCDHVCSRGRGASLTLLVFISIFQMCGAAGQDRGHPVILSHFLVNILLILTFLCIWIRLVLARRNGRTLAQEQDSSERYKSRPVHLRSKRCPPSLQPLPGSSCVCAMASSDCDSNSYVSNLGFEPPERPLYSTPPPSRHPDTERPQACAVMATGDPTPEVGVRNQQALHALSELVVGGSGSEDPHGGMARTRRLTKRSVSRAVSLRYENANMRSFNADALEADSGGEIVKDDSTLPPDSGSAQRMARHAKEREELVYPSHKGFSHLETSSEDSMDDAML